MNLSSSSSASSPLSLPPSPVNNSTGPALVFLLDQNSVGIRTAARCCLQDIGYFVVDNLPATLVPHLLEELSSTSHARVYSTNHQSADQVSLTPTDPLGYAIGVQSLPPALIGVS